MGTDSTVFNLVKTEGVRGAFRGGSLSWISGVNRMGYFTIYERAVSIFDRINVSSRLSGYDRAGHTTKSVNNAAAAAVASVVSQAVLTPVSVVTTHLHVHPCNNVSVTQVTRAIVAQHGRWGVLWTGELFALFIKMLRYCYNMYSTYRVFVSFSTSNSYKHDTIRSIHIYKKSC